MIIVSLFDGISCGRVALERVGIKVDKYYSSEIDKNAISVTKNNYPDNIQLGDVVKLKRFLKAKMSVLKKLILKNNKYAKLILELKNNKIDLIIGGSPCQGFSKAGLQLNFNDPRSKLFFEYVEVLEILNPKHFLLENVCMKQEYRDIISSYLGVQPIRINSSLVSAQKRDRLYWTNIPDVEVPEDKGILLESILENGDVDQDKAYCLDANYFKGTNVKTYLTKSKRQIVWMIPEATKKGYVEVSEGQCIDLTFIKSKTRRGRLMIEKSNCLTATNFNYCKVTSDWFRKLTPVECERLQTLPDNYTEGISNTQRYKCLGNGWTVDVITHILKGIKEN
ncbi:DNA cytosine methyltransferase [Inconstantimicrobium mannanitabidum]|uniref:Cytosine-specific methyltransferase n=1 Tax=Inconstantimicrobium mannanitabidum TaxID=1604901 RepID=A0ACB5R8V4_9CLOT|nr:DNA cytosine methyltransferase [Clostridium sp. TW13]GKX65628.1 cytosine-specific methyltransferase [Clostridium sp. TW13]